MKLFFILLVVATSQNSLAQDGYTVNLLIPHRNIKNATKFPVRINGTKFIMRQGSYTAGKIMNDTATVALCSLGWTVTRFSATFPLKQDIFIVAYYDSKAATGNKYSFKEVRLETFYQLKGKCRRRVYALN